MQSADDERPGEGAAAIWAGALFFLILAGYYILRPVRDALPRTKDLPELFLATFVTMLLVVPLWGAAVRRWPRRRFVPVCYQAFAVQLVVLAWLVGADSPVDPVVVSKIFYVWTSVFNMFVVSVFWSLAADMFSEGQARRLFAPIAGGGTLGAIAGPLLTTQLTEYLTVSGLLLIAVGLLQLAVVCALGLDRAATRMGTARDASAPVGGGLLDGLRHIARSPVLRMIAGYVICTSIYATFLYLEQGSIANAAYPDREDRTAFFASIDLWTNLGVVVVQALVTSALLRRIGVGAVLAILPIVQGLGLGLLAIAPTVTALVIVQATGRSVTHAMIRPARELLFTTMSRDDKYKAKNAIDTVVLRFGDWTSARGHDGLYALGASLGGVALVAAPIALAWFGLALALGMAHRRGTPGA